MERLCPHCRRPMPVERFGVRLTELKAELLDAIARAGDLGISSTELISDVYRDRRRVGEHAIKSHVWQLREQLEGTGVTIFSDRRRWFLVRRRVRRAA